MNRLWPEHQALLLELWELCAERERAVNGVKHPVLSRSSVLKKTEAGIARILVEVEKACELRRKLESGEWVAQAAS